MMNNELCMFMNDDALLTNMHANIFGVIAIYTRPVDVHVPKSNPDWSRLCTSW